MRKKSLITMILSMALVAAVGVGGTLAYLSQTSNTVTNNFTVGSGYEEDDDEHTGIYVDETEYEYDEDDDENKIVHEGDDEDSPVKRTDDGNSYENLLPGDVLVKDPKVNMVGGSVASYVFVKIDGVDALEAVKDSEGNQAIAITGWDTASWVKIAEIDGKATEKTTGDGYYVYRGSLATDDVVNVSKEEKGKKITLPEPVFTNVEVNIDLVEMPEGELASVKVQSCAVQATRDRQGYADAFAQAPAGFAPAANN